MSTNCARKLTAAFSLSLLLSATGLSTACTRSYYDLFPEEEASTAETTTSCLGLECETSTETSTTSLTSGGETTGSSTGGGSSTADSGGEGSGGNQSSSMGGTSGVDSTENCSSQLVAGESLKLIRFVESDRCLWQGPRVRLATESGFLITTAECTQRPVASWVIEETGTGGLVFRHEATGLNLDVRYAAPTNGTPLVLAAGHASYNQRFRPVFETEEGRLLAPQHVESQCLTEINGGVEIWPCNPTAAAQRLEIVDCKDVPPPESP